MPFGHTHSAIRSLANAAINTFYARIEVLGEENVPQDGPLLVVANHGNMTVDPAVLSCNMPHRIRLHYWAKDGLFRNRYAAAILLDAGNIPVDRKTKNNQQLFAKTFDAFKCGEAIAVFPEGTSTHTHDVAAIKDGASWAALEYAKNLREQGATMSSGETVKDPKDVVISVCGITYTEKTRYRSCAVLEFGPAIAVEPYIDDFLQDPKAAVKKLSTHILAELRRLTVNAPDWDTLNAAIMTRQLLWRYDTDVPLWQYRTLMQGLVDHYASSTVPNGVKALLLELHQALKEADITSSSLGPATLPRDLDPNKTVSLPSRLSTLFTLIKSSLSSLVRLPFFALPLCVHLPIYIAGRLVIPLINPDEPESFAQNKIVFGILLLAMTYPALFFFLWALLALNPLGGVLAFVSVYWFAKYHNALIDSNYRRGRRLMTSWRILLSIWLPQIHRAGKPAETRMRRVLRLRAEAMRALHAHLAQMETQGGKGAALVSKLRNAGAVMLAPDANVTSADEQ